MKMIVAIIRPDKFEAVQAALVAREVVLMTVSDVRGCGMQRGFTEQFHGSRGIIRLLSKVKLEIAVNDEYVKPTVGSDQQSRAVRARPDRRRKDIRSPVGRLSADSYGRDGIGGNWSVIGAKCLFNLGLTRLRVPVVGTRGLFCRIE